jgi:hypothetical protein
VRALPGPSGSRSRSGQSHTGRMPTALVEPGEELGQPVDGHLDVLHHALALGATRARVEPAHDAEPGVEAHQPVVDVGAAPAPRPQPPYPRVVQSERAGAPEPVGVPAPQVVVAAEHVGLALPDALEVDLLARVVAGAHAGLGLRPAGQGQVGLAGSEHDPVEAVDLLALPGAGLGDLGDGLREQPEVVEPHVAQAPPRARSAPARCAAGWRSRGSRRSWGRSRTGRRARCRASPSPPRRRP